MAGVRKIQFGGTYYDILPETQQDVTALKTDVDNLYGADEVLEGKIDDIETDLVNYPNTAYVEDGTAYFMHDDVQLFSVTGIGGGGGGGGGDSSASSQLIVTATTGWFTKTISQGDSCVITMNWSSTSNDTPTGPGTVTVKVGGVVKANLAVEQGNIQFDIAPYLSQGSGTNKVQITITDSFGTASRPFVFTISVVDLSISSTFDASAIYDDAFVFPYTPIGAVEKTVYFYVDGTLIGTQSLGTVSGRQQTYTIPAQTHGSHSLRVYFEGEVNGQLVRSNEIYYEFIYVDSASSATIIASSFNKTAMNQYDAVAIPFRVYTPSSSTTAISIYINNNLVSEQTVDRTEHSYTFRANETGTNIFQIVARNTTKQFAIQVAETSIDVHAETGSLVLHLDAEGRENTQSNRATWTNENDVISGYEDLSAQLTGFNWRIDGWLKDEDDINVLRLLGDSRVTIPYKLFGTDYKSTGKTIEIEFSTHNVADYTTTLLSCYSATDKIGLRITPQTITFNGAQTEISTLYKENEHVRLSVVVEKQTLETRLILIYINGIMSRAIQYAAGERFSQPTPLDITIGSNDCGIDIYNIRVYDNDLTREQVLSNWIADTQIGADMLDRYTHNNVYDESLNITVANLPNDLPYMIIEADELPQYKGHKKTGISGSYTDPVDATKSFTFTGCEMDVQGTSSSVYFRKNYDMKFKSGFVTNAGTVANYALRTGSIPFNRFVLKADVASSESTNNTGLTMFYNDTCPYKTPEMEANSKVRWGIEGVPIVMFWHDTTTDTTQFMGKQNLLM